MPVRCYACSEVDIAQKAKGIQRHARVAMLNQTKDLEEEGCAIDMRGEEVGEV